MDFESQEFNWPCFWLMEVILLSAPSLITVIYLRTDGYVSPHTAGRWGIVLIGLTLLNVIVFKAKAAFANRFPPEEACTELIWHFARTARRARSRHKLRGDAFTLFLTGGLNVIVKLRTRRERH